MTNDLIRRGDALRIVKGAWTRSKTPEDFYALTVTAFENVLPYAQPEKSTTEEKSQLSEEKSTRKLIYLDDAIDALCQVDEYNSRSISAIKHLPSAQQKKGKWVRITQGAMPEQYICPFCHRTVEDYGVEELLSIRYPYCHCGADMRGENIC